MSGDQLRGLLDTFRKTTQSFQKRDLTILLLLTILLAEFSLGSINITEKTTLFNDKNGLSRSVFCIFYEPDAEDMYLCTGEGVSIVDSYYYGYEFTPVINESLFRDIEFYHGPHEVLLHHPPLYGLTLDGEVYWISENSLVLEHTSFSEMAISNELGLMFLNYYRENLLIYDLVTGNTSETSQSDLLLYGVNDLFCLDSLILVGTGAGLAIYNVTSDTFTEFWMYSSTERIRIYCIEYDSITHTLYLGTTHGVYVYNLTGNTLELSFVLNDADGLLASDITCLELDTTADRLYIGTYFGVSVCDLRTMQIVKSYTNLFGSYSQGVGDILLLRRGRLRELYVAGSGLVILEVNNLPNLTQYVTIFSGSILTLLGIPSALLAIYIRGKERTLTSRILAAYLLLLCVVVLSMWLIYLQSILLIPNLATPSG